MNEKGTITTKEGDVLTIEEWVEKKENKINPEFSKLQEREVITQRKCLKRRMGKNGISPEYDKEHSEVRHLTEEEIKKEYKMAGRIRAGSERGDTIRELIKFLQELEGRKVSTDIIVQKTKKPVKSISSFLSQLFNAGIVARVRMKDHKRKFIWGIAIPYKDGELEAVISTFNDFTAEKRRNQYLKKKEKEENKEEATNAEIKFIEGEEKDIPFLSPEEIKAKDKSEELGERLTELVEEEQKISTSSSNTLKIVVQGNIKILFGLVK